MKLTCLNIMKAYCTVFKFQWSSPQVFHAFSKGHSHFCKRRMNNNFLSWCYYSKASINLKTVVSEILGSESSSQDDPVKTQLIKTLTLLHNSGVSVKDIEHYRGSLQSHSSYHKTLCLIKIKDNPTEILPLLTLPLMTLRNMVKQVRDDKAQITNFKDRLAYLQHQLELDRNKLVELVVKHPILLTLPFSKLDMKMHILKEANISTEHIVKDVWIFNYTEALLSERTHAAQCTGLLLKPWHLRCTKKYFNTWLSKAKETQSILQGEDQMSYLAKRLECSREYVEHMIQKNVFLPNVNVRKLEKVLDFLFEKGYTVEEIRLFPKVFCCSVETLEKRFQVFQEVKGTIPTVPQISLLTNFNSGLKTVPATAV